MPEFKPNKSAVLCALLAVVVIAVIGTSVGARRAGFRPVPISTCGAPYQNDYYAIDMGNNAGTVAWNPYSTQSRISLEGYAESPEAGAPLNPVTGVGKGATVRVLGDRYRRYRDFDKLSMYQIQPGQAGYLSLVDAGVLEPGANYMESVGDGAFSLLSAVSGRQPPEVVHDIKHPLKAGEVDGDFLTDGPYGEGVLKEGLTSRRAPAWNPYTASRVGLGSVRLDPRFEPGPQARVAGGDASPSHGGHAGGITLGALGSQEFRPAAGWDWRYVDGFGDDYGMGYGRAEAVTTEHSRWGGTSGYQ